MNTITHQQARDLIDHRLDGRLKAHQQALLDDHLRSCDACRLYASEMDLLPTRLTHEFRARWDNDPGPSARLMDHVTSQAKRIPAANRFSSNLRFVSGAVALLLLALVVNFVVSRLQSTSASSTNSTPTVRAPVNLTIDPQSCKPAAEGSVPNELYGYEVIQNTSLVQGDFTFDFWLYCDPSLKVNDKEHYSAVSGLGIYSSWRYNGPRAAGPVEYYYGFEENQEFGKSSIDGQLYKSSAEGKLGIYISEAKLRNYMEQGEPVQFRVTVNSALGRNDAILSFRLQPTNGGVQVLDLQAQQPENGNSGLITFVSEESGNTDIYTMRADGTGLTNLTNDPAQDANPIWSRDGKHIAFESRGNGFSQIYVMDADGSNLIQLTNDNADHRLSLNLDGKSNPWSPDGRDLFFLQSPSGGDIWELYVMGINGANKTLLVSGRFSLNGISWSPDGKYIAYVLNEASNPNETFVTGMYVVDADGNNPRQLKNYIQQDKNLGSPYHWSADGKSILFVANQENTSEDTIYELNLESDTLFEKNTLPRVVDWHNDIVLTWEKDFAWHRSDGSANTLAWEDSSCLVDITPSSHGNYAIGAYCPDRHTFKLYVANPDGSVIKQLLDTPDITGEIGDIAWSLDDRYLTFPIATDDKTSLYILNVEAALVNPSLQPTQIVIGSHGLLYAVPSWQPVQTSEAVEQSPTPAVPSQERPDIGTGKSNGEWIAFLEGKTISSINLPNLYLIHPDGTGLVNLTGSAEYYFFPQWSPDGKHLLFARGNHTFEILRMNDTNSFEVLVTTDIPLDKPFEYQYSWSPNSEQIAFLDSRDGNIDIYTAYADGRNDLGYTRLTTDPAQDYGFVWSPDGSQLAFQRLDGKQLSVVIMNADGSNQHEVARGSDEIIPFRSSNVRLRWSFDGTSLYASSVGNSWLDCSGCVQKPAIYRMDLAASSVQQIYYEADASKVNGWYLYDTPQNTLYFMRIEPANFVAFWGSWFRADGNTVSELGELDPQQSCKTTTGSVLNESISPNERFSVISVFCAGGFDLYLADREAAEANDRIIHLLRLPLDTVGQGGDFATLPIGWSPDGRWLIYDNGNGSLVLLDIEKALQDPNTALVTLLQPEAGNGADSLSLLGGTWQPAP